MDFNFIFLNLSTNSFNLGNSCNPVGKCDNIASISFFFLTALAGTNVPITQKQKNCAFYVS